MRCCRGAVGGGPAPAAAPNPPPPESPLGVSLFLSCLSRAFQGFPSLEEMATVASVGLNVALICRLSIFFFRSSNVSLSKRALCLFSPTADRRMTSQLKWDTRPRGWEPAEASRWRAGERQTRAWQIKRKKDGLMASPPEVMLLPSRLIS